MEPKIKSQRGYLLIVAVILIVIVSFIGGSIAYIYIGSSKSNTNILRSNDAFYVANSGLEMVKRSLIARGRSCPHISGNFANVELPAGTPKTGEFTVTGDDVLAFAALSGSITSSSADVTANDASDFASELGTALIENEIITYPKKASNTLQNMKRGVAGTTAAAHPTAPLTTALIKQHMCVLQSVGQVPTTATSSAPDGKRVIREPIAMGMGYLPVDRSLPGLLLMPALIGADNVNLRRTNSVINNIIDPRGCAVAARGSVSLGGASSTAICKSISNPNNVWSGDTEISNNLATFHSYFFSQSLTDMQNAVPLSCRTTNSAQINNLLTSPNCDVVWYNPGSGTLQLPNLTPDPNQKVKTLIVDNNLTVPSGVSMTNGQPVKIIVKNSLTTATNSNNIYAFFYVQNTTTLGRDSTLYGAVASFNVIAGSAQGGITVNYTQAVFDRLSASSTATVSMTSEVYN
ncbi:MAG: hypothetical protein ACD_21C00234G0001 [uncultured bacterium]|nr:MAG: hypothetical protein ACD_21C00234G0001 [uncultured bacterium]